MKAAEILKDGLIHKEKAERFAVKGWRLNDEEAEISQAGEELGNVPLFGGLIVSNEVSILGGDDRAGKTKFCMAMTAAMLEAREFIPGFECEIQEPIILVLDLELNANGNVKRNRSLWEKFKGRKRVYTLRPEYSEMDSGADDVGQILDVIEKAVNSTGAHLLIFDNILAWLGDGASNNDTTTKLYRGLKAIIERRNALGKSFSVLLLAHLTKSAQDRREESGAMAKSRKSDIRGSGGMQSTAAAVMELRESGASENQSVLIVFNTRHAKPENLSKHGKGYAFEVSHKPGDWKHEFLSVVDLSHHFGENQSAAPIEIKQASKIDASLAATIRHLHSKKESDNKIHKALKDSMGKDAPSRATVSAWMRAHGLEANGKQYAAK